MKILGWNPHAGELAVVPGGPACAQYVAPLGVTDVQAIAQGHKGYYPTHLELLNADSGEVLDIIHYDSRFGKWCCSEGGGMSRTLENIRRRARQYFNCAVTFRARNLSAGGQP